MPDDRIKSPDAEQKLPKPEVYVIRDGETVFKPGMKTWFAEEDDGSGIVGSVRGGNGEIVGGTVCTCNKVCTCNTVCTCESHTTCSCQSYTTCSCQKVSSGTSCSCNRVCSCVPVH